MAVVEYLQGTRKGRVLQVKDRKCGTCGKPYATRSCRECYTNFIAAKIARRCIEHEQICKKAGISAQYLPTVVDLYCERSTELESLSLYDYLTRVEVMSYPL